MLNLQQLQAQQKQSSNTIAEGRAEIQLRLLLLDLMSDAQKAKDEGTREGIISKIQSLAEGSGKTAEQVTGTKMPDASSIFKNNQPTLGKTVNLSGGVKQAAAADNVAPKAAAGDTDTVEIGKTDAAAGKKGVSAASGDIIGGELGSGDITELNTETYSQMSSELQGEISRIMDEGGGAGNGATFKDIAEKLNASGYEAEWTHINDASDGQGNVTVTDKDGKTFRLHESNGDGTLNANEINLNDSLSSFKNDVNKTEGANADKTKTDTAKQVQDVRVITTREEAAEYQKQTGRQAWNKAECPLCKGAGCGYCSDSVPKTGVMGGVLGDQDPTKINNSGETNVQKSQSIAKPATIQKAQQLTAQNPLLEQFSEFSDITDQVDQPFGLGESSLQSLIARILEMIYGNSNN